MDGPQAMAANININHHARSRYLPLKVCIMLLDIQESLPHLRDHHRHHHLMLLKITLTLQAMLLDRNTIVLLGRELCLILQRSYKYISSGACNHCHHKNVRYILERNWLSL